MANGNVTVVTTGRIKFIKTGFQRDYDELNLIIKEWYEGMINKEGLCLAISRKAPRLMEWCRQNYGALSKPLHVVSELALPFMDMSQYNSCVVVDEAIYHGTTFSKVLSIAHSISKEETDVMAYPLVMTSEALANNNILKTLTTTTRIDKSDIHFFIDTIISKFLTLGKPYDIEYTIFYIDLNCEVNEDIMSHILNTMGSHETIRHNVGLEDVCHFSTKTYSREMKRDYTSYTYLTDYLYRKIPESLRPELSKLRFFSKGNRLCVVSMSPYRLNEANLVEHTEVLQGTLGEVWQYIYAVSQKLNTDIDNEEFRYQKRKSLVVMMNYLLSFAQFQALKSSLKDALADYTSGDFHISELDLNYLLGERVGKEVADKLNQVSDKNGVNLAAMVPAYMVEDSVIPLLYSHPYQFWMSIGNIDNRKLSISEMMSNQFSAMHWQVEIPSRSSEESFNRLRFGESYSSLHHRYLAYFKDEAVVRKQLNRGIDSRIDRGSVVPNYVCQELSQGSSWMRLFRSGENEDFFKDQLLRSMVFIFRSYCERRKINLVHTQELRLILFLIALHEQTYDGNNGIFGRKLEALYKDSLYRVIVSLEETEEDLIDFAINNKIISSEENDTWRLADTPYVRQLADGVGLSEQDEKRLSDYIEYVAKLHDEGYDFFDMRELINYLMYNRSHLQEDAHSYYLKLKNFIEDDAEFDFADMESTFFDLYRRMPEPYLRIPKFGEVSSYIGDIQKYVGSEMEPVQRTMQTDFLFDKLITSFYVLNVWSEVNFGISSSKFNFDYLEQKFEYLSGLSEGKIIYEWIKANGSFDALKRNPLDALKRQLLKLFNYVL